MISSVFRAGPAYPHIIYIYIGVSVVGTPVGVREAKRKTTILDTPNLVCIYIRWIYNYIRVCIWADQVTFRGLATSWW